MIHQDLDILVLKLVNPLRVLNKEVTKVRILNPLVIIAIKKDILLISVGVRKSISKAYLRARDTVISATCKVILHKTVGQMSP